MQMIDANDGFKVDKGFFILDLYLSIEENKH